MDHSDDGPRGYQFSAAPIGLLNHPKALVTSKSYHWVITTSISLNTTARQLEGNRGEYGGRGRKELWSGGQLMEDVWLAAV